MQKLANLVAANPFLSGFLIAQIRDQAMNKRNASRLAGKAETQSLFLAFPQ